MSARMRVGWCPSVVTPMAAADGLLVRVKPTAATISACALAALADAAARYGNGLIDLTNRGNLQMRGLKPDTVETFAEVARAHGLAAADPALEEVRNVAADPLGPEDPDAAFDSHAIARAVEAMLAADPRLTGLPPKFGFVVDCGRLLTVPDARADILVRARDGGLTIALDGGAAALPCTPDEAPEMARRLALAFLDLAGTPDAPPYRMRELVELVGERAILSSAGLAAAPEWVPDQVRDTSPSEVDPACRDRKDVKQTQPRAPDLIRGPQATREAAADDSGGALPASLRAAHLALMYAAPPAASPVGYLPFPGREGGHPDHRRDNGAFVAGVPRGRIEAATLAGIAGLAERFADATVRMTPWRAFALVPVRAGRAKDLSAGLAALDLITDPADPRRALQGPDIEPASRPLVRPEAIAP